MRSLFLTLLLAAPTPAPAATQTFMPENDLHLEDGGFDFGGIDEDQFNAIIAAADEIYTPLVRSHFGATLTIERRWRDATVNAYALQRNARDWRVVMFGGLARRPEVTADGFAIVLCHEIGHHLAGYPFASSWAANEGQSDYFSTAVCAQKLLEVTEDLGHGDELPEEVKDRCDAAHPARGARATCYRAVAGGKSLAELLGGGPGSVDYDTPDRRVVARTNHAHPAAQCRLDTYVAGALCGDERWSDGVIPGKQGSGRNTKTAQDEAYAKSCRNGVGARPRCWFAPLR